ncbi:MAG: 7TM-DISM domain-containing protein, partial [Bacteroidota bacterium]
MAISVIPACKQRRVKHYLLIPVFFFLLYNTAFTQLATITNENQAYTISSDMEQWVDSSGLFTAEHVLQKGKFVNTKGRIPIFPNRIKNVWFRFSVKNLSSSPTAFLNIAYSNLSRVSLYSVERQRVTLMGKEGNEVIQSKEIAGLPNIIFNLQANPDSTKQYLLHVYSQHPIIVPAKV